MDALEDVSIRLAERVAPDEVELAPSIAEAAAQGGKEWDNLIKPFGGAMHGGILPGAEGVGDIHALMDVVRTCSNILSSFCQIGSASLSIIVSFLALRDRAQRARDVQKLASNERELLERSINAIMVELEKRGVVQQRAAELADHTLITLGEKPDVGRDFVERISSGK